MKCNLEITSMFGGENTKVSGTIEIKYGEKTVTHTIDCSGSASARGVYAKIDGVDKWWCGSDHPGSDGPRELEEAVEELFEMAYDSVEELGIDPEDNWEAKVVNGKVTSAKEIEGEDDED